MQLVSRAVHHQVNDAQVGNELVSALFVADVLIATQELEVDAHFAESIFIVVFHPCTRGVDIVGYAEVLAGFADNLRCLAVPTLRNLREHSEFCVDAQVFGYCPQLLDKIARQVWFLIQKDRPDNFHCLDVVWSFIVVEF